MTGDKKARDVSNVVPLAFASQIRVAVVGREESQKLVSAALVHPFYRNAVLLTLAGLRTDSRRKSHPPNGCNIFLAPIGNSVRSISNEQYF